MIFPLLFSVIALVALFLKLPGVPELFGIVHCKSCATFSPYLPMIAVAYFSALITSILCFRTLPSPSIRCAGLVWSIGLALTLTYLNPTWCSICFLAHTCHIVIWISWRPTQLQPEEMIGMKLATIFTSFVAAMALFSTLHFTFLIYSFHNPTLVKAGTPVPSFASETGPTILHFVSAQCPYCKEQTSILDKIAQEFREKGFRFFNVGNAFPSSHLEQTEDPNLFSLFGIEEYPTLVLLDSSGVVVQALAGASTDFEEVLKKQLQELLQKIKSN